MVSCSPSSLTSSSESRVESFPSNKGFGGYPILTSGLVTDVASMILERRSPTVLLEGSRFIIVLPAGALSLRRMTAF